MKWVTRTLGAGVLACLLLPASAGPSYALFGSGGSCDRTDNDRMEASRVIRNIAGRIDAMETAVVEALRLQTGQLSGYQAQSAKAVVEGLDAQTKLRAQTAREVEKSRIVRQHRPSRRGCRTATGVRGMAGARRAAAAEKERATVAGVGRIAGDRSVGAGSVADNSQRFEAVMRRFCNRQRLGENAEACAGRPEMHGADLDPGKLFDKATIAGPEERSTAIELSRNLAAPVVHDQLPVASAETSLERRRALLGRSADARTALAADYFDHARAMRAPGAELGGWAAAIAPGREATGPVSRYEIMQILASRRFEDSDWVVKLQAMSDSNLLREIATLMSISLMVDWERYRLDERRGAAGAAALAIAAEGMRRLPGLGNPAAQGVQ